MTADTDPMTAARAAALFVSDISAFTHPSPAEVDAAIRVFLGTRGERACAAEVAAAYGDYPDVAAGRMRWARGLVETLYTSLPHDLARAA